LQGLKLQFIVLETFQHFYPHCEPSALRLRCRHVRCQTHN
jgi:hypothetical protein